MAIDPEQFKVTAEDMTPEMLEQAAELLSKKLLHEARVEAGEIKGTYSVPWAEMTEEQKEKAKAYTRRRNAKINVLIRKASEAGITCSEEEINGELARMSVK